MTSITNDIASLETAVSRSESYVQSLNSRISGIDVDIAHENQTISTANYYISNSKVSETVRDYWRGKRQSAQNRIADLESEKTGISMQKASEETYIASAKQQINTKQLE